MRAGHLTCVVGAVTTAALAVPVMLPGWVHAQQVAGRVVEDGTRAPIGDAQVLLVESDGAGRMVAVTDSSGAFALALAAGGYSVRVERLGYETYTSPILELGSGETLSIEIRLGVGAVPLEPLTVTARISGPRGRAGEFDERRTNPARAGGFFLTREDMERGMGGRTTDVLARVPAVVLRPIAPPGAPPEQSIGRYLVQMRGGIRGSCSPALFLDGVRVLQSEATVIDDFTYPAQLDGIEVYARASLAPTQYAAGNDCGVILFWTRSAEVGSDWNWKRIALGTAGLGILFVLIFR